MVIRHDAKFVIQFDREMPDLNRTQIAYRKHQSVIYGEKSSRVELDLLVGDLQREHLDLVDEVVLLGLYFVDELAGFARLQQIEVIKIKTNIYVAHSILI